MADPQRGRCSSASVARKHQGAADRLHKIRCGFVAALVLGRSGRIVCDGKECAAVKLPHRQRDIRSARIHRGEEQMFQRFFEVQGAGDDGGHGFQQHMDLDAALVRVGRDLTVHSSGEVTQIDGRALRRLREESANDERIQSSLRFLSAIQLAHKAFGCLFGNARTTKTNHQRKQRSSEKEEVERAHAI